MNECMNEFGFAIVNPSIYKHDSHTESAAISDNTNNIFDKTCWVFCMYVKLIYSKRKKNSKHVN